jgi:hypothetical protein
MNKTHKRINKSRRRKYSREKYSKNKNYSNRKRKLSKNRKRNMKGGLVQLYEFGNEREILVLKEDDQETEYPEGSLVIKDDDTHEYLRGGEFNSIIMKEWIMGGLNKKGYGIGNPEDIKLYKDGKRSGNLFTGDREEDAEDEISIYVELPPRVPEEGEGEGAREGAVSGEPAPSVQTTPPVINTGHRVRWAEEYYEELKQEAEEIYPNEGFIGTAIIKLFYREPRHVYNITLKDLETLYNIYIKDEKVNQVNVFGDTMIGLAVHNKKYDVIDFLSKRPGINLNNAQSINNPLYIAAFHDLDLDMTGFLLNLKNEDGTYKIDRGIIYTDKHMGLLWILLFRKIMTPDVPPDDAASAVEIIKKLIESGADLNEKGPPHGTRTLLEGALFLVEGDVMSDSRNELIAYLRLKGADDGRQKASLNKFLDGIPFSAFKENKKKRTVKRGKKVKKMKKMKRTKKKKMRTVKRCKRTKKKYIKKCRVPPSGVILRKNGRLFKSDGKNLKAID